MRALDVVLRTARAVHRALVGGRIGIVALKTQQVELTGRLGGRREIIRQIGRTLLLEAAVIGPRVFIDQGCKPGSGAASSIARS